MPRRPEPRWNKKLGRWFARLGEVGADGRTARVWAPPGLGRRDQAGVWAWFEAQQKAREPVPVPSNVTVEWVAEHWLAWCEAQRDAGKLPAQEYANRARHIGLAADRLGAGRACSTLEPDDATALGVALLDAGYAPTYSRNVLASLRGALTWAVKAKHLPANPIKGFRSPTVPRSPARFAERAEAAAFLRHWRTRTDRATKLGRFDRLTLLLVRCLIRTGARPKELCRLQWSDLRWAGWRTSRGLDAALAVIPYDRTKTGKVTGKPRTIYFTPAMTRALRREHGRRIHEEWVFVHGRGRGGKGAGEPWRDGSTLSKAILRVRRELIARQATMRILMGAGAKVDPWDERLTAVPIEDAGANRLTNYRWRHTAISTLLMEGVDVSTVGELTGTSPAMIHRTYGHLLDSHLRKAAEALEGARRR